MTKHFHSTLSIRRNETPYYRSLNARVGSLEAVDLTRSHAPLLFLVFASDRALVTVGDRLHF
jgi:hypothetical protein